MSVQIDSAPASLARLSVGQFAERFRAELIPLSNTFSYFCASVPLSGEDLKEYLEEPIAALPPTIAAKLPKVSILLVPYLERGQGKQKSHDKLSDFVCVEKPAVNKLSWASQVSLENETVLLFALKDQELAEYHYTFYHRLSALVAENWTTEAQNQFFGLLRKELAAAVHGEVDEESWRSKQSLQRRQNNVPQETKAFREYARASFVDTLTLYLHGICCDIDVETGPRQLPSRHLRKRLQLLNELYPPPDGYVLFPEGLKKT